MRSAEAFQVEALNVRIQALEAGRTALIEENTRLTAIVKEYYRPAQFYLRMQKLIADDENIRDAWIEFYTFLCLAAPNIAELNEEP